MAPPLWLRRDRANRLPSPPVRGWRDLLAKIYPDHRDEVPERQPHVIVCGDEPLAHRVVEELSTRYLVPVVAIMPSRKRNHGPQIVKLPGVRVIESERLDTDAFRAARISSAAAIAFVQQDDLGNVHAALRAQELKPGLRVVLRMFNVNLGNGMRRIIDDCAVISDASIAAPAFVAAALGEVAPSYVRLPGRTLYVARRVEVDPNRVVAGLADTRKPGDPVLLPADPGQANLVLAIADGTPTWRPESPIRRAWTRLRLNLQSFASALVNTTLGRAGLAMALVIVIGTGILAAVSNMTWGSAAYVTLLNAVGATNQDTGLTPGQRWLQVIVSLAGLALVPILTAAVVDGLVNSRIAGAQGRLTRRYENHVVVIGLGNVGTRVIRQLADLGVDVVAVDRAESARGTRLARELRVPIVIGDAGREETLRAASVQTSRAVIALSDDVTNLAAALYGRSLKSDLRVVLRLFDAEMAQRVQQSFNINLSRSVSYLAAPAFVAALLDREVIGTISVGRRVLVIAVIPLAAGSPWIGARLRNLEAAGELRVLGVSVDRGRTTDWTPAAFRQLDEGDRIFVVATRAGLGRVQLGPGQSATPRIQPAAT
jgi:Trk K+ transport system NAD-binding subunit